MVLMAVADVALSWGSVNSAVAPEKTRAKTTPPSSMNTVKNTSTCVRGHAQHRPRCIMTSAREGRTPQSLTPSNLWGRWLYS